MTTRESSKGLRRILRCAHLPDRLKGTLVVLGGVLVLTPDSLLIRQVKHYNAWTIAFGRQILLFFTLLTATLVTTPPGERWRTLKAGFPGVLCAIAPLSLTQLSFPFAILMTTVANTLGIIASNPLFAGLFSTLFLREHAPLSLWLAIVAVLSGVALVFIDDINGSGLWGNLLALVVAITVGIYFVVVKALLRKHSHLSPMLIVAYAALLTTIVSAAAGELDFTPLGYFKWSDIGWFVIQGCLSIPIAFACLTIGPRYLHPAEAALFLNVEVVLGPFYVFLSEGETPSTMALIGVSIVLFTMVAHSALVLWQSRREQRKTNGEVMVADKDRGTEKMTKADTQPTRLESIDVGVDVSPADARQNECDCDGVEDRERVAMEGVAVVTCAAGCERPDLRDSGQRTAGA
ncbi:unnamed protein product [Vitrella brassicaformis CCMP3155]|uniref:EamA domain-containing protein n=1 Tax=Vitrella brassicaformis (strain CCMP3155) TaxID=1169540 RepID=A0A0G4G0W8_VITBC|nr:unnamed protein product [Vitrella brassicaformis CCMP3155]|mmetsp:Transcript_15158/g.36099  ORF Transcript_15158/g.36099 Transcript_15158/m.36099 type:complete len:405 (-) Transcript_15158:123-1337(-)|eukprot:CEM21703.1 unnamed protein product [Vitrella brassicaformis CCMP3155]